MSPRRMTLSSSPRSPKKSSEKATHLKISLKKPWKKQKRNLKTKN